METYNNDISLMASSNSNSFIYDVSIENNTITVDFTTPNPHYWSSQNQTFNSIIFY